MKRLFNPAVGIFFVALGLSLPGERARADEWTVEGHVVGVSDGETITVLDDAETQHKIRLLGIDAPENAQAFGELSRKNLSALVFQKRVEARCHKRDRHGQEVCAVFVGLRDAGFAQIRAGMAWWDRAYAHVQRAHERELYRDAELAASAMRIGLWKGSDADAAVGVRSERQAVTKPRETARSASTPTALPRADVQPAAERVK